MYICNDELISLTADVVDESAKNIQNMILNKQLKTHSITFCGVIIVIGWAYAAFKLFGLYFIMA